MFGRVERQYKEKQLVSHKKTIIHHFLSSNLNDSRSISRKYSSVHIDIEKIQPITVLGY